MTCYVDSSVILRVVLGQQDALKAWKTISVGVVSALAEVECLRTLDRLRLRTAVSDTELADRREAVHAILNAMELVEPTRAVLTRAAQPLPTELGTLDAIHLATALMWADARGTELTMATHDSALAIAARAVGMPVIGIS